MTDPLILKDGPFYLGKTDGGGRGGVILVHIRLLHSFWCAATIFSARAPATVSMYDRAFRRRKEFALTEVRESYQGYQKRRGRASFSEERAVEEHFGQGWLCQRQYHFWDFGL